MQKKFGFGIFIIFGFLSCAVVLKIADKRLRRLSRKIKEKLKKKSIFARLDKWAKGVAMPQSFHPNTKKYANKHSLL